MPGAQGPGVKKLIEGVACITHFHPLYVRHHDDVVGLHGEDHSSFGWVQQLTQGSERQ